VGGDLGSSGVYDVVGRERRRYCVNTCCTLKTSHSIVRKKKRKGKRKEKRKEKKKKEKKKRKEKKEKKKEKKEKEKVEERRRV
jgi:hypothetical protein